jgi:formyl-CoA transferase
VGISVADIAAGMYAFTGVLTALYERATTGVARAVEISLFEALAEWMGSPAYYTQYGGRAPARIGTAHATIAPYGLFPTGDGGAIMLSIQHEGEWAAFCEIVLGDPGLAHDPRFDSVAARVANRAAVDKMVADRLAALDAGAATELMDRANVANARYNSMTEFLAHPVLAGRDRWRDVDTPGGPIRALLPPTNLSGVEPRMAAVPGIGEHTESILRELGCADQTIATLRRDNAI